MRVVIISVGSVFVVLVGILITKLWGQSQVHREYKHPFFTEQTTELPLIFINPSFQSVKSTLEGSENIYINAAVTMDQKLVIPLKKFDRTVRHKMLADIRDSVITIEEASKFFSKNRKIIFNLTENAIAEHEIFMEHMKKIKMEKGENFLVLSSYEAPIKALKELAPALVFGPTQPEILKIVAMQSMYLLEAVNIRADAIVHPLKIRNKNFFNEDLLKEMKRRNKKIIVGPIDPSETDQARQFSPFGIIVNR